MAKVFVTYPIPGPGVDMLREAGHAVTLNPEQRFLSAGELHEAIAGCDGVLTQLRDPVNAAFFDAAGPTLRIVSNFAVGYNNIDVAEATRRGVIACNTPGVLTDATADIAWALLMGVARRVSEGDRKVRGGQWSGWKPSELLGGDIAGQTLAIIGAGRIGAAVARRAAGWDMRVIYTARTPKPDMDAMGAEHVELDEALRQADYVSLHVPLTDATRHMINAQRLAMMKPTAYVINTARGAVIDEAALITALKTGTIAGAGLDVYEAEPAVSPGLLECDNTLLLPHIGSATVRTRAAMSTLSAKNLLAVLAGKRPPHAINGDTL